MIPSKLCQSCKGLTYCEERTVCKKYISLIQKEVKSCEKFKAKDNKVKLEDVREIPDKCKKCDKVICACNLEHCSKEMLPCK